MNKFLLLSTVVMYDCSIKEVYPAVELTSNVADSAVSIGKEDRAALQMRKTTNTPRRRNGSNRNLEIQ